MTFKLHGLVAATHTPFDSNGDLNLAAVEAQAAYLARHRVGTAFIGGSTGESHSLSFQERIELTERWARVAPSHGLQVVVHVGSNCLRDARALAIHAESMGAAAVSAETEVGAPCVSWDGAVIAYEKWSLYGDVFKMGADGTNPTPIYQPGLDCLNPCLSPDGQAVIFSMNNSGVPQLFRTSVRGEGLAQVTNEAEGVSWGRYSPDGTKIVFVTSSGDVDVKIMDADGGNIRTVASGYQIQDMPTFSPDGASLVYMENFGSDFTPNYQIMKVAVAGGAAVRMTTTNEDDRSPCFSEDGNYLLFTRKVGAAREIFRMGVTGGTAAQVSTFGAWTGWLSAKKR